MHISAGFLFGLVFVTAALAQPPATPVKKPAAVVAGIPVNYEESLVGSYTLPDPLILANGKPVRDAETWTRQRRPEIVKLFEENQYGRAPGRPADMRFEVVEKGSPASGDHSLRSRRTESQAGSFALSARGFHKARARSSEHWLLGQFQHGERPWY
jgi:hypothetical protein